MISRGLVKETEALVAEGLLRIIRLVRPSVTGSAQPFCGVKFPRLILLHPSRGQLANSSPSRENGFARLSPENHAFFSKRATSSRRRT